MQSIHQNNVCTALIRESNEDCFRGSSKQMCKNILIPIQVSLLKLAECISVGNLSLPAFQHMKLGTLMDSLWVRVNYLPMHSCSDFYDNTLPCIITFSNMGGQQHYEPWRRTFAVVSWHVQCLKNVWMNLSLPLYTCILFVLIMYLRMYVYISTNMNIFCLSCTFFFWTFQFLTYKKMFRIHLEVSAYRTVSLWFENQ